jgi:hypothetical protein
MADPSNPNPAIAWASRRLPANTSVENNLRYSSFEFIIRSELQDGPCRTIPARPVIRRQVFEVKSPFSASGMKITFEASRASDVDDDHGSNRYISSH